VKICVHYNVKNGPWGGGNQFLRALISQFRENQTLSDSLDRAEVHLFNSHQNVKEVVQAVRKHPNATFIQRLDGPMRLYNDRLDSRDTIAFLLTKYIPDGVVFQSQWSRRETLKRGIIKQDQKTVVIHNSADEKIFFRPSQTKRRSKKVRLIISSWSSNQKKGFEIYDWLDENLDFDRYSVKFVGNSPRDFQNIVAIAPVPSKELGRMLRESDVFLTASQNDPCSNSVIEALLSGVPVLALASGGHPELVQQGGMLFHGKSDILEKIDEISTNLESFRAAIFVKRMATVTLSYQAFFQEVREFRGRSPQKRSHLVLLALPFLAKVILLKEALMRRIFAQRWLVARFSKGRIWD
jgi:glycosyltransferase involved in cell wall biosynthesis